jgi:hypothetical protein
VEIVKSSAVEMQDWVEDIRRKFRSLHEGNAGSHTHSVELSKRLWIIDRVERLGIGRYFEKEIKESFAYIHRYDSVRVEHKCECIISKTWY